MSLAVTVDTRSTFFRFHREASTLYTAGVGVGNAVPYKKLNDLSEKLLPTDANARGGYWYPCAARAPFHRCCAAPCVFARAWADRHLSFAFDSERYHEVRRQRVINRWWLYYMMSRNPSIIRYRKQVSSAVRASPAFRCLDSRLCAAWRCCVGDEHRACTACVCLRLLDARYVAVSCRAASRRAAVKRGLTATLSVVALMHQER